MPSYMYSYTILQMLTLYSLTLIKLQENKANNTWPGPMKQQQQQQQQQPWGKNVLAPGMIEPSAMPSHLHPPLQMQWSDPLTNRPLTTWGSGKKKPINFKLV